MPDRVKEKLVELQMQAPIGWTKGEFADYLISHGVTVQEWISVKDRYPDEAGFYIGFFEARPGHWRVSTLHWNGTNWNNIGGYIPTSVRTTHWMPLPQPPKGE